MEASLWERLWGKLGLFLIFMAMLVKSLIQYSVVRWGCVPFLLFDLRPNYGLGKADNDDLLQKDLKYSMPLILWQATVDQHLCQRLLDTHRQVWVSLLWDHCSFLLGPGVHKVLFVPSKSVFP